MISTQAAQDTEAGWLALQRAGYRPAEIARTLGIRPSKVYAGISAARLRESRNGSEAEAPRLPRLVPAYGSSCKPLALLTCADVHPHGPIPAGSRCVCMAGHCTGIEGHPRLRRDPATDPKPEPKPKRVRPKPLTRKQRRKAVA